MNTNNQFVMSVCRFKIFIPLLFLFSCQDNKKRDDASNNPSSKSDTVVIKFTDYTGKNMVRGFVGIHLKDAEELSSTIEDNPNRMLSVDSSGILKLHKPTIANDYRITANDRLTAFYTLPPKTYKWFVLDLSKDSILVKVVYL